MTQDEKILKLINLLDVAIEYIDQIADEDSETLAWLKENFEEVTE